MRAACIGLAFVTAEGLVKEGSRPTLKLGIRCDKCGLEALSRPTIEQPSFHVFSDGVLCEDCYAKALEANR